MTDAHTRVDQSCSAAADYQVGINRFNSDTGFNLPQRLRDLEKSLVKVGDSMPGHNFQSSEI
jgi:hypothetical protein